jgi:hypothetical protein
MSGLRDSKKSEVMQAAGVLASVDEKFIAALKAKGAELEGR